MKKNVMKGLLAACMLLVCMVGRSQTSADPVGTWTFSCPDAPYEYSTGKVEFKKQNGKLTLAMIVNEQAGKAVEVKKTGKAYSCNYTVDGYDLVMTLNPDGDNLKGAVATGEWELGITLKPAKK
ncbi:hypothetical protein FACS1894181_16500 [Bacteroidia bacterium]|nr:hypothetical protein FACS1894181_16500 [Bacteroidia bacterium]